MNRSFEGVVTFLRDNDTVLKQLMETGETATHEIEELATRLDHAREEAQVLIDQLGAVAFSVGQQEPGIGGGFEQLVLTIGTEPMVVTPDHAAPDSGHPGYGGGVPPNAGHKL